MTELITNDDKEADKVPEFADLSSLAATDGDTERMRRTDSTKQIKQLLC